MKPEEVIEQLTRERDALREALRPFAECQVESFGSMPDEKVWLWKPNQTSKDLPGISIAHMKRARHVWNLYTHSKL